MEMRFLYLLLFLLCFGISPLASASSSAKNMFVGIKLVSFSNPDGTTATGDCCDQPGKKTGACAANMCDTALQLCATGGNTHTPCDVIPNQKIPTTPNINSFNFSKMVGTGSNKKSRIISAIVKLTSNINVNIEALETATAGSAGSKPIGKFNFVINWVDPKFNGPPKYRKQVLKDGGKQLIVEAYSQCAFHYYGPTCSVYCKSQRGKYKCLNNGAVKCLPGYNNPICFPAKTTTTTTTTATTTATTKPTAKSGSSKRNQNTTSSAGGGSDNDDDDDDGLAAGLSVGILAMLLLGVGSAYYFVFRNKKVKQSQVGISDNQTNTALEKATA